MGCGNWSLTYLYAASAMVARWHAPLYFGLSAYFSKASPMVSREGMNCLLEVMASVWMTARRQVMTEPVVEEVASAQEGLEQCRRNMEGRERELQAHVERLTSEALAKKREGDLLQARARVQERRRCVKRIERLRHGIDLVDTQLDAIKTSELDKEIMLTLKASSTAMRKAGITVGLKEAESVMSEIDQQLHEAQDLTEVLATPLMSVGGSVAGGGLVAVEESDLDEELDLLERGGDPPTVVQPTAVPVGPNSMSQDGSRQIPAASSQEEFGWNPRRVGLTEAVV